MHTKVDMSGSRGDGSPGGPLTRGWTEAGSVDREGGTGTKEAGGITVTGVGPVITSARESTMTIPGKEEGMGTESDSGLPVTVPSHGAVLLKRR